MNNAFNNEENIQKSGGQSLVAVMQNSPAAEATQKLPAEPKLQEELLDNGEELLRLLEEALSVRLVPRGGDLQIFGAQESVERAAAVLRQLFRLRADGVAIDRVSINYQIAVWEQRLGGSSEADSAALGKLIYTTPKGKQIRAKSFGQQAYLQAIDDCEICFGIGPAGTGKTYLAVIKAADYLKKRRVKKLVLVRPAVEAGEKLGFLPGDLQEKVNPYLRPIYDALDDALGTEASAKYMERGLIEVVPLAYMRGRTLDNSFIILDEAQNTTPQQMKMFLTRMGMGSRAVITGDITQIDLPGGTKSGLRDAQEVLRGIKGIAFCYLTDLDVVRHPLVQKIIEAYQRQQ